MAVLVCLENRYSGSNGSIRIRPSRTIDLLKLGRFLTKLWIGYLGAFEGAESNGDVSNSLKSIFVVELSFASVGATTAPMTSKLQR